ncbi:MAG: ATP-binding protein [Bacteroidota bacterium]
MIEKYLYSLDSNTIQYKRHLWELEILKTGINQNELHKELIILHPNNYSDSIFLNLHKAEYAIHHNEQDKAFDLTNEALEIAIRKKDSLLVCESIYNLFQIISRNPRLKRFNKRLITLYKKWSYNPLEKSYFYYFDFYFNYRQSADKLKLKDIGIRVAQDSKLDYPLMEFYQRIGVVYDVYLKRPDSAIYYYNRTLSLLNQIGDYYFINQRRKGVLNNLGCIHYDKEDFSIALDHFNNAYRIKSSFKRLFNDSIIVDWKSKTHDKLNQCDSAFYFLRIKDTISRMLAQERYAGLIEEGRRKFDNEKLRANNLEIEKKRISSRNWLIAASITLLLGTGIAILLQKNTTKKRLLAEKEAMLKQQRVENLLKEQELVSIDAMIAGQEKERQKVAGELHDDLGSLMATIKLHFDNAKISKKDASLQHAQKLLEEAYQKVRGMAHHKNSGVMSDQGLLPAIKKMAKTITETDAMEVTVEDFGLGERMENTLELSIFRMIQELVANAIKHADATKVNIQLTQHKENLNIIVDDNGKGFDRSQIDKQTSGMGLTTIEKRVEHLEGSFTVDSVIGKGTSILIDIPV